jgi:hypothetical protein
MQHLTQTLYRIQEDITLLHYFLILSILQRWSRRFHDAMHLVDSAV